MAMPPNLFFLEVAKYNFAPKGGTRLIVSEVQLGAWLVQAEQPAQKLVQLSVGCHQKTSGSEWGRVEDVPVSEASVPSGAALQFAPHPQLDPPSFQPSRAQGSPALLTSPSGRGASPGLLCPSCLPSPEHHL